MKRILSAFAALLLALAAVSAFAEEPADIPDFENPIPEPDDPTQEENPEIVPEEPEEEPEPEPVQPVPPEPAEPVPEPDEPGKEPEPVPASEEPSEPEPVPERPSKPVGRVNPVGSGLPLGTSSDLCPHEHLRTVYYFDTPVYEPVDNAYHAVSGPATVEIVCDDCKNVLSAEVNPNAEEVRPHIYRKGKCVLCGREDSVPAAPKAPEETIRVLSPEDDDRPDLFLCTLTGKELEEAEGILVLRPEGRDAALALQAEMLRKDLEAINGVLTAEMDLPEGQPISVFVRLVSGEGEENPPEPDRLALRIYGNSEGGQADPLEVTYTPAEEDEGEPRTEQALWVEVEKPNESYWQLPWLGDGFYGVVSGQ